MVQFLSGGWSQISHKEWFESFNGMDEIHWTALTRNNPAWPE